MLGMRRHSWGWIGVALAVTAWAPGARAASREVERLQVQVTTLQTQVSDLSRMVDELKAELRRLNESLADQSSTMKRGLQDQRTQQEAVLTSLRDISERLGDLSQAPSVPAPPASYGGDPSAPAANPTPGASVPPGAPSAAASGAPAPRELYSQAYADFARGNYDLAVQGFQEYLRNYPATDFSDNAQYWIGECMYGKQRFQDAVDAWKLLFRDYPSSDKLPDAHVKSGMALEKLGRRSQALIEYRFVVDRYPNTQAARIARDKLNPN